MVINIYIYKYYCLYASRKTILMLKHQFIYLNKILYIIKFNVQLKIKFNELGNISQTTSICRRMRGILYISVI